MSGPTQDELKTRVAEAALAELVPGSIVGIGTGSTVDRFIDALAASRIAIRGAVASSERSSLRLRQAGIPVYDCNDVDSLPVYVDGADEIDAAGCMIKGGGAALTREKIVADIAARFVCICDASKRVETLGAFPLPIEVIAMATAQIERRLRAIGGRAVMRAGVLTDNQCPILDVHGLSIVDPPALEAEINQWPGVVSVGIFARRRADICLIGSTEGVQTLVFPAPGGGTLHGATVKSA